MIKRSTQQENRTFINIYASNIGAPKYIKQILTDIKREIDNIIIVGDFNTPLKSADRSSRQKISKGTLALNSTVDQMKLIDIYKTLHPKAARYIFFSSAHTAFSKIDHVRPQKKSQYFQED